METNNGVETTGSGFGGEDLEESKVEEVKREVVSDGLKKDSEEGDDDVFEEAAMDDAETTPTAGADLGKNVVKDNVDNMGDSLAEEVDGVAFDAAEKEIKERVSDLNDVSEDGLRSDLRRTYDKVEEELLSDSGAAAVTTVDEIVVSVDNGIVVNQKSDGVVLQNGQNGVPFSDNLNSEEVPIVKEEGDDNVFEEAATNDAETTPQTAELENNVVKNNGNNMGDSLEEDDADTRNLDDAGQKEAEKVIEKEGKEEVQDLKDVVPEELHSHLQQAYTKVEQESLSDLVSSEDDRIVVNEESSGVVLQKWQNGVTFSDVLNAEGPVVKEEIPNIVAGNNQEQRKHTQLESRDASGFEGERQDTGPNGETQIDTAYDVELKNYTSGNKGILKDSSATAESNQHETSPKLDDNLHAYVEEESKVVDNFEIAASDVAGKSEKQADVEVKQSTGGITEPEFRPAADVPSSTKSTAPALTRAPTASRPAGLGHAAPLLEPSPRVVSQPRVNGTDSHTQNQVIEDSTNGEAEENDETREKLQMIRVKFLRLAHRLGQTPHNVVVAQVLYRLGLAEQLRGGNGGRVAAFSFDRASAMAEQLESGGQEPLDFSCTIMVLGKTGVGKSATINSIFDQVKFDTDAFQLGTRKVQDVVGTVQGIKVRVIDTPGLLPSWSDQIKNEKILHSVKRFIKKSPPDIVLYLDRLDMQSRDSGDMPLLRTITDTFGPSIWFNAIVVLTHAASAPPEGPNGVATSYDMFVTQRSHVVQQAIRQAAGDMRLMNPVSLVENHSACRTNRAGQRVLPNGQVWKPHLLLLSFASKILAEANTLLKLQDSPPGKPFAARVRAPPLPFLLTSLLRSRPQLKLPHEQFGDDDDTLDDDLDESTESNDESEYDELPPFKNLTRDQLAQLTKAQKKAYYDELEYREKLYMEKQLKEEKQRQRMMKKMAAVAKDLPNDYSEGLEDENAGAASVPVPMADLPLPASFDSDNPTHRYRCLDTANQWLIRPVLDSHSWDHDVGYEGVNMERLFVVKSKIPMSFSGQVTKDKKEAHFQMEVAGSVKHDEGKATTLGFDMQQIGKDIAYTIRSDTKFSNYRRNKATASLSVTHLGDAVTAGVKVEDKLIVSRQGQVVMSGGAIAGRGDVAYGGSLEATLRDKDHPIGRFLTTMSLSVMDWHGDLATGWNAQTQIPIGRFTNLIGSVNFNNRGQGQVSIRMNSSEQLQIALVALVPFIRKLLGYSQPMQFGH